MGNLGGGEVLVILFIALIVLGPNKLPEAARQVGRAVNEIRRISGGFQREMREAMNEPVRMAEEAKSQIMDPFGQGASSAAPSATASPTADAGEDPPLPTATPKPTVETSPEPTAAEEPPATDTSDD
jgi:sec-independent protein translocase protein TatB